MSFQPTYPYNLPLLPPQYQLRDFTKLILQARVALAELKGYIMTLPNPTLVISPAVLRESVASSNIENINTTLAEVLQNELFPEVERRPLDKEVLRYRDAVLWGVNHLESFALSTRLITGIQKELMPDGHGEYRRIQNQIVNTATNEVLYTPPSAAAIPNLMGNWEYYANQPDENVDPLIRASIAHYQFESIHPFLDGNGRTGRILIVLQLMQEGIISLPVLYISGYINKHRSDYYRLLRQITTSATWDDFIEFMLHGFLSQALATQTSFVKMVSLNRQFKNQIKLLLPKVYSSDLVDALFTSPVISPVRLAKMLSIHYTTASKYLLLLAKNKLLKEGLYGKYHLFINQQLINILKN